MKTKEEAENVKAGLRKKPIQQKMGDDCWLSTGSTLLNLACSGRPDGGFFKGGYFFFVGDTTSGKTFLSLTSFAEATINPAFDDYRLIHDEVEGGALMDFARFFGQRVADRVEPPARDKHGAPVYSQTAQQFYYHLDDAFRVGRPFIYVLDSQDSLSSEEEIKKFGKLKKAARGQRDDEAGSYGDAKAKVHSANLRRVLRPLADSGSILLILNQTRDSFDMFQKSTYSGGRALLFYASLQLWSSVAGKLDRMVKGKKRELGIISKVRVKKNRITGRDRSVVIPIYHSCGVDDVGGCVDYLVDEGIWERTREGVITVTGLGPTWEQRREPLIRRIEEQDLGEDLRSLVAETWEEIEQACRVPRKNRYNAV